MRALERLDMNAKAGEVLEHLGRFEAALTAYCKGHAYRPALLLARSVAPQRTVELHEEWGTWLESQKQVEPAISHFIEAGNVEKAINAAVEYGLWEKAAHYITSMPGRSRSPELKEGAKRVAQHYEAIMNFSEAEKFYLMAGVPREALGMYCRAGMWDNAQRLAKDNLSPEEAGKFYGQQAKDLEKAGKLKDAERLYLNVNNVSGAADMYKRNKMYDEAVRVIVTARPEEAKKAHADVARLLEKEQKFKDAERHYVEGRAYSEAVRMYKERGMWDDALRVARTGGGQKAANEIALVRATAVGGEGGVQMLVQMGMAPLAVDFACDNDLFDLAFATAKEHCPAKLDEARIRQAEKLRSQRRYADAVAAFLSAKAYKQAVAMQLELHDFASAKHIAETNDPSLLDDVLVAEAKLCVEQGELHQAEELFARVRKPHLTVQMYIDFGRWGDALRIAEEVEKGIKTGSLSTAALPGDDGEKIRALLRNTVQKYGDYLDGSGAMERASVRELREIARVFEASGDAEMAIRACLTASTTSPSGRGADGMGDDQGVMFGGEGVTADELEEIWLNAIRVANRASGVNAQEVASKVAQRLLTIKRFDGAANVLKEVGLTYKAIQACMAGQIWDKAMQLAKGTDYEKMVTDEFVDQMKKQNRAQDLMSHGHISAAISVWMAQGNWEAVFQAAPREGPTAPAKYAAMYAERQAQEGNVTEALSILVRHGATANPEHAQLYRKVAQHALGQVGIDMIDVGMLDNLKSFLQNLITASRAAPSSAFPLQQFISLLSATYFTLHLDVCKQRGYKDLAATVATGMLRYLDFLPADRAFYEAGVCCRDQGNLKYAYVFLNQYLDIADAIDMKMKRRDRYSSDLGDMYDLNLPANIRVPDSHFRGSTELLRKQIKSWGIKIAMEKSVENMTDQQECAYCGALLRTSTFECAQCSRTREACIVSGMLITKPSERVECTSCRMPAKKDAWNQWILSNRDCPYCHTQGRPV